jgi:hypothetical protein
MSTVLQQRQEMNSLAVGDEIKFISTIGSLGKDRRIINIPKKFHKDIEGLEDKEVLVTIREIKLELKDVD